MNGARQGYPTTVMPDDAAGPPLTPAEQTAIADLERRFLLGAPAAGRGRVVVARPARLGPARRAAPTIMAPLVALAVTAVLLLGVAIGLAAGPLGAAAVLASTAATALVWLLLPARFGGPTRTRRRAPRPVRRRS